MQISRHGFNHYIVYSFTQLKKANDKKEVSEQGKSETAPTTTATPKPPVASKQDAVKASTPAKAAVVQVKKSELTMKKKLKK